jgi:16S rRNA (guanine527-N7)-methyltransferase
MSQLQKLASFCQQNDLPWDDGTADKFATYLGLLTHFNKAMNLIGPMSAAEVVDQLLIDSVAPAAVYAPTGPILDVGSGAGLPGVPLKLLYPDLALTMVEPRKKRTTFLKIALNRLDLDDTTIERERIEEVDQASYDYVISKAFQPPLQWLETASGWMSDEGVAVCMTRPQERAGLEGRAEELGLELKASCDDTTALGAPPVGDRRAIYVFKKTANARA